VQCTAYSILKENLPRKAVMTNESEITISDKKKTRPSLRPPFDDMFESFRREIDDVFLTPLWSRSWEWRLPSFGTELDTRMPLCDIVDKGDKYEVSLEVPGIPKEKLDIKATKLRCLDNRKKRPKRRGEIMCIMNVHTSLSAGVYLFQKKLFHQKSMQKWKTVSLS
jgi:hypothetical protein